MEKFPPGRRTATDTACADLQRSLRVFSRRQVLGAGTLAMTGSQPARVLPADRSGWFVRRDTRTGRAVRASSGPGGRVPAS